MRRQQEVQELLDGELDPRLLHGNLRDLTRTNELLGGADLSWRAIEPFMTSPGSTPLRLIDVGTGSADIPRALMNQAARRGKALQIVATDVRAQIVVYARQASLGMSGLDIRLADADRISEVTDSFDLAHSSLLLHHLAPDRARRLLAEMARVATAAVVVNDLVRSRTWLAGAWLLSRVATRNAYTRHDAPLSVRRAYTERELVALAADAGLRPVARYRATPPYRHALVFTRMKARG